MTFYGPDRLGGRRPKAVVFFILVAIIALAQNKITGRKEVQLIMNARKTKHGGVLTALFFADFL